MVPNTSLGNRQMLYSRVAYFIVSEIEYNKYIALVFTAWALTMLVVGLVLFALSHELSLRFSINLWYTGAYTLFARKFLFVSQIAVRTSVEVFHAGYNSCYKLLDKGIFEVLLPYGVTSILSSSVRKMKLIHSSILYHYAGLLCLALIMLLMFLSNSV